MTTNQKIIMTPMQCSMARNGLHWSTARLAKNATVGLNSVNRYETGQDARPETIAKMQTALEAAGAEFIVFGDGAVGVKMRPSLLPIDELRDRRLDEMLDRNMRKAGED